MVKVSINDRDIITVNTQSLDKILLDLGYSIEKIAVAIDGNFISRSDFFTTKLTNGQRIDVVSPVQGG